MKKLILLVAITIGFTLNSNAQDVKTIALEQTKGEFVQKSLTVSEGTYVFAVANNNVGKDVGLVLVPEGKDPSKAENHIQTAYVTQVVKDGQVEKSKATKLIKGKYVYFCPLNPTPQYTLTVK